MKKYFKYIAALLLPLAAGCSDSDDWTPGPQDAETGVSAYFSTDSKTSYIFDSEGKAEEMNAEFTLYRQNSAEAASIPLIFSADTEGFSLPEAAQFAAGETATTVAVNCSGIEKGREFTFTLSLPEDETNVYGPGLHGVTCKVIKSEWKVIADNVRYLYSNTDYSPMYPATYSKMYHLDGTFMFRLEDFFGSGLDVNFECTSTDRTAFLPLNNAVFNEEYQYWYLYDEEQDIYPSWIPEDADGYPAIQYLSIYQALNYTSIYMNYQPETLYGYIAFTSGVNFDDGNFAYGAWQADFNLKYNPFE